MTDYVYYIAHNGEMDPHKPFSSYEEAWEFIMESGMHHEGEWEIIEWDVD